jgi:hypothetical protein
MSCNCNTASKTCDPCAFCTPPGVTGLTTCAPVDPCDGETIDSECVIYSGVDYECIDVASGDTLISVLLSILETYFPEADCCKMLNGTLTRNPVSYTFCYSYDDGTCGRACECDSTTTVVTLWSLNDPLAVGSLLYSNSSLTTLAPEGWYSRNGKCYVVTGGTSLPGPDGQIQSINNCTVPTTTSTTTTTTIAPTTTTTTLIQPTTCNCYGIFNPTERAKAFTWTDCIKLTAQFEIVGPGATEYRCSRSDGFLPSLELVITNYGLCGTSCPPTSTTTTTTAPPSPVCKCIVMIYRGDSTSFNITYVDCEGITSDPFTISVETPIFYVCGSNPQTTDTDVDFYTGANCFGDECTYSFMISNSLNGASITGVNTPGFIVYELFPEYSFPVTCIGPVTTVTGIHGPYNDSFNVSINNTGVAGCLKLLVNNVVVDTSSVTASASVIYTLTLPAAVTAVDIIKIELTPGPC